MQSTDIQFDLENPSEKDVMAVLIPAMLRRKGVLKGKFLHGTSFKDESGEFDIQVSAVSPEKAIDELNEYTSQLEDISIESVVVATSNLAQATLNFVEKTYVEFKQAIVKNIDTTATLVPGQSAVLHSFAQPFRSGHMKSLEMKLLAGNKVTVTLRLSLPSLGNSSLPQV